MLDYKKWCSGNKINWSINYHVIVSAENASSRSFRLANMFHNKWFCGWQYRLSDRQYTHRHFIQPTEARTSSRNRGVGGWVGDSLKITTSYPIQREWLTVVSNIRKQLWKSNRTNFICRLHHKYINLSETKRCIRSLQWSNSSLLIKDFHYSRHCESPV